MICKKHPRYKALRKPTCDCIACRAFYEAKNSFEKDGNRKWDDLTQIEKRLVVQSYFVKLFR